ENFATHKRQKYSVACQASAFRERSDVESLLQRSRCIMSAQHTDRIASLDGLRAISIALVLLAHLAGTRGFPVSTAWGAVLPLGELGVHVFFVISGFLITRLLFEELDRRQRISLGAFYVRRTLRIFPPYYTLIFVLLCAEFAGWLQLAPRDVSH